MQRCEDNVAARLNGNALQPLSGVQVVVTSDATGLPASLYSDDGVTPLAQPLVTDDNGYYGFYAANGEYTLQFSGVRIATFTRKVVLADPSDNPYASKAELAAGSGSSLVIFMQSGAGAVPQDVQTTLREIVYAEQFPTLQQAIAAAAGKTLVLNHTYTVDNSAADGLLVNVDDIRITGTGRLNCTSIANSGIKITGKRVTIENITVQGPGTYDTSGTGGAVIPGLVYIDGTGLTAPINCRLQNVNVLEPGKMGIVAYKAVGFEILGCRVENSRPVSTWLNTSNNHLIRAYSCARFKISGNRLKGFTEGIVTQAYDAGTYTFDDFDGTTGNKCRKFEISGNHVAGTYDHCVYVCNENEHYICNDNVLRCATDAEGGEGTCSLKLEGGYFEACGNYSTEGIQLRNPYNGRVENNMVPIYSGRGTTHNPSKMGILSQDVAFQRAQAGMVYNNNTIVAMGAIDIDAGIWIEGALWSGYQSQLVDLSICNNTILGAGRSATGNGFGILVHQDMPTSVGVVTGNTGQGVTITGNTIDLSTFTGYTGGNGSYGIELLNIDNANVTGNTVRNFSLRGVNALGMRYSLVSNNNLSGNPASAAQKFATYEDASNTALHVDSVQNVYGTNHAQNVAYKYFIASETTVCRDLLPILNLGANNANQTIAAYDECELIVWAPTTAGLTLAFTTTRPWGSGQKIKVVNRGSASFNVTNTSTTIAAGNAVTFCCTGSNTFIAYV